MGRTLQKAKGQEEQVAMFMPILEGLDGIEKMSKSLGNYIGVSEPANVMFKKVMEIPDNLIIKYFELATDEHPDIVDKIKEQLKNGKNPRDVKFELAKIITGLYHSDEEVKESIKFYDAAFSKKSIPENIPEIKMNDSIKHLEDIIQVLIDDNFIQSKSEIRRLISQGGVQINGEKINEISAILNNGDVIKIGKKKFVKIVL